MMLVRGIFSGMMFLVVVLGTFLNGCGSQESGEGSTPSFAREDELPASSVAFLDSLQERTFHYFWDLSDPITGLTPDRAPSPSFASVAATGFALSAYPIGVERGYVTRDQASRRALSTLEFFWNAPQDSASTSTGYRGFYFHFLDMETGARFGSVELSTVDTAIFLAGALVCQAYFDGASAVEDSIRALAELLYERVDWQWASIRPPTIGHGWTPENGHLPYDWRGYNEAMLVYLLALGAPRHAVGAEAWAAWTEGYKWGGIPGRRMPGIRSALRSPVHAMLGRPARNPRRVHAATGDRLLREFPARELWPATLCHPESGGLAGLRCSYVGLDGM